MGRVYFFGLIFRFSLRCLYISSNLLLAEEVLNLVILHTNDIHSRFQPFSSKETDCKKEHIESAEGCYGGLAKRASLVNNIRNISKYNSNDLVLFLDAGDQFQGTPWFYIYKGRAASHFMTKIKYDAMALGNHEFDNKVEGLIPFLLNITNVAILCSNLDRDATVVPKEILDKVKPSKVFTSKHNGIEFKIAIIGYLTTEVNILAKTDEATSIGKEIDRLKSEGVNFFIALGHAGYNFDKELAKKEKRLGLIVGGHSHTFLYNGTPPTTKERAYDTYPFVIKQRDTGQAQTLVVQAGAFGKYLGFINITINRTGKILSWSGNPILLDKTVDDDADMASELKQFEKGVIDNFNKILGSSSVFLDTSDGQCRMQECIMGNFIADSMVAYYSNHPRWRDKLSIALINGGGLRRSIDIGNITYGDLMQVLPFTDLYEIIEIKGRYLISALEYSVTNLTSSDKKGRFLQVSGLRIKYDLSRPGSKRITSLKVDKCFRCNNYNSVEDEKIYFIILPYYLYNGGDGFDMLRESIMHKVDVIDLDVIIDYLNNSSPITAEIENRIVFANDTSNGADQQALFLTYAIYVYVVPLLKVLQIRILLIVNV